jgi:aspartyl-tRNA(Asn)/glutamyl-tRNA(Gln) amidotransferase subunit A
VSEPRSSAPVPRTVQGLAAAYRSGAVLPVAATKAYLARIQDLNSRLNCFITVLGDSALRAAEESEARAKGGRLLGPLDGVPIAVKDLIYIQGVKCTAGSRVLANNIAGYDAAVVANLKAAGAVLIGTTNLHEFAAGVTNVNPHYGPVRNPWDESRISGGSSGGSAAAVASGMAPAAIGTDTGGSVRIPAALCGIIGLKPTYGRVSRLGVVPLSSSLDTVGVLASCAWDACALLQSISVKAKDDMTTVASEVPDYFAELSLPLRSPRVGVLDGFFHDDIDPAVEENFLAFVSRLKLIGCKTSEASFDWVGEAYDNWFPIRKAEATAFHANWLSSFPELYGDDVRKLLEDGKAVAAVDYVSAVNARPSFMERFSVSMKDFDFLVAPCTSVPAPRVDQSQVRIGGREVSLRSALIRPSIPFNYVGCPVMALPSGFADGLPVGVQVVGRLFDEAGLLRLAKAYEDMFGLPPSPQLEGPSPAIS